MPARRGEQTNVRSRLAAARVAQGITQEELARVVGISRTSLVRLERKAVRDPPLGWYVNCAIALRLSLEDILDDDAYDWHPYDRLQPPLDGWVDQLRARENK